MKVAIIFFGLTRNLKNTFRSIRQYVFIPLASQKINYDIYLHTYNLSSITNLRSHEYDIPLDNDEWKMLSPYKYIIENQDEVDTKLRLDEFCKFKNPWPEDHSKNSMKNLLRQLNSLKKAWKLIENEPEYDAYIILRPDLYYMSPIITKNLKFPVQNLDMYIPQWGKTRDGENDRFCVTSKSGAFVYMNRIEHIFEYAKIDAPNSHRFLKAILDKCEIKRFPLNVKAVRIRADGQKLDMNNVYNFGLYTFYKRIIAKYNNTEIKECQDPYETIEKRIEIAPETDFYVDK